MKTVVLIISLFFFPSETKSQTSFPRNFVLANSIVFLDSLDQKIDFPLSSGYSSLTAQIIDLNQNGLKNLIFLNKNYTKPFISEQEKINSLQFKMLDFKLSDIKLERWFHFIDHDFDGDFDVLTFDEYDVLGLLKNMGTLKEPIYSKYKRIRDEAGKLIITEFGNIPVLFDIDLDGKKDLFLTVQTSGFIIYYQNVGITENVFRKITDRYADVQVIARAKHQTKHGQSTFTFVDFDKDKDFDILWGDQFQKNFYYLENTGTLENPKYPRLDESFPPNNQLKTTRNYNIPLISDINGDGYSDIILLPREDNLRTFHLYLGTKTFDQFDLSSTQLISTIDAGFTSAIDYYDVNKDTRKDFIISTFSNGKNTFELQFFIQNSKRQYKYSKKFSNLHLPLSRLYLGVYDIQLIDFNKDGLWDICFLDENATLNYVKNTGTIESPIFKRSTSLFSEPTGNKGQFRIADINEDGKFDLITSNKNGIIKIFSSENGNFDKTVSTNLLENAFDTRVLIGKITEQSYILYSSKKIMILTFKQNFTFSARDFSLNFDQVDALNSLRIDDINSDGRVDLAFGHENGGLLVFEANDLKEIQVKKYPIYPNPSSAHQTYYHNSKEPIKKLEFFNIIGQKINIRYKIKKNMVTWIFSKRIRAGVYFVRINDKMYKIVKL